MIEQIYNKFLKPKNLFSRFMNYFSKSVKIFTNALSAQVLAPTALY